MKLILLVAASGLAAARLIDRRTPSCTPDNCLRALTGTGSNQMATRPIIASSDCSTFMSTLVIATVTAPDVSVFKLCINPD
jgi:hypothetical protein